MKKLKSITLAVLACFAMLPIAQSYANTLEAIKQRGKIIVAIDLGAPPYGFLDGGAEPAGSDVEAANALAKDMGVELEIIPVTGANRIPYLIGNKADVVISSLSITEERKKVIDYSIPMGVVPTVVSGPKDEEIKDVADLAGKTVAVSRASTQDNVLSAKAKEIGDITIVRYEDDATSNTAIVTGQQTILASSAANAVELRKRNPSLDLAKKFILSSAPYAIGIRKNDSELKAWLDNWVQTNLDSGKMNEIYKKHFGEDLPKEFQPKQ